MAILTVPFEVSPGRRLRHALALPAGCARRRLLAPVVAAAPVLLHAANASIGAPASALSFRNFIHSPPHH